MSDPASSPILAKNPCNSVLDFSDSIFLSRPIWGHHVRLEGYWICQNLAYSNKLTRTATVTPTVLSVIESDSSFSPLGGQSSSRPDTSPSSSPLPDLSWLVSHLTALGYSSRKFFHIPLFVSAFDTVSDLAVGSFGCLALQLLPPLSVVDSHAA